MAAERTCSRQGLNEPGTARTRWNVGGLRERPTTCLLFDILRRHRIRPSPDDFYRSTLLCAQELQGMSRTCLGEVQRFAKTYPVRLLSSCRGVGPELPQGERRRGNGNGKSCVAPITPDRCCEILLSDHRDLWPGIAPSRPPNKARLSR